MGDWADGGREGGGGSREEENREEENDHVESSGIYIGLEERRVEEARIEAQGAKTEVGATKTET